MMTPISSPEDRLERREFIRLLRETPPQQLAALGEAETLNAFHRVAQSVPFYARLLRERGIDPAGIRTIESFRAQAPLLDKYNTFGKHEIAELCADGNLDGVRSVLTSSGFLSGIFSFGVNTVENLARSAKSIDTGLQYLFNVDDKSTLLINCLPMGVKVNTRAAVLAETSVREDMVFAVIRKFAKEFDQILLVGEGSFVKKIIEEGAELHGIDWPALDVNLITGEEGIAENYRTYVGGLLGIDDFDAPGGKIVGSSMGVAELDLNIFHETRETIRIRRLAHRVPAFRKALFGAEQDVCPMLFVYYPHRCFIEELATTNGPSELVISMLSAEMKIPLLRYRSGDFGSTISHAAMLGALAPFNASIVPDLQLPFVAVSGRGAALETDDGRLSPEAVKEALYAHAAIARSITGNFRLSPEGRRARLDIQLRRGKQVVPSGRDLVLDALRAFSPVSPVVHFRPHDDFPYNVGVDWERKFVYLGRPAAGLAPNGGTQTARPGGRA